MDQITILKNSLTERFLDSDIEVFDLAEGQDYLGIKVSSPEFQGKSLLEQHRLVMEIVDESLKQGLHAVQIKTSVKK